MTTKESATTIDFDSDCNENLKKKRTFALSAECSRLPKKQRIVPPLQSSRVSTLADPVVQKQSGHVEHATHSNSSLQGQQKRKNGGAGPDGVTTAIRPRDELTRDPPRSPIIAAGPDPQQDGWPSWFVPPSQYPRQYGLSFFQQSQHPQQQNGPLSSFAPPSWSTSNCH